MKKEGINKLNGEEIQLQASTKAESEWIDSQIDSYNLRQISFSGQHPKVEKNYILKIGEQIVAGINSVFYFDSVLYIGVLFVNEKYRKLGLGRTLIQTIEDEGKILGANLIHLDTFDFQAKEFYIKQGYEIFGTLNDCPKGHKRFYLKKDL